MARQKGIMKLEGTIGGITFYKTSLDGHLAKEKGGVDGARIANDPAFIRTRENGEEFGAAGIAGKQLRDAIRSLMMTASDSRVTSRLTQVMTDIVKQDVTSVRGKRTPAIGLATVPGKALLKGFNFNLNAVLGAILFKPFTLVPATGVTTINGIIPVNDVAFPAGATHMTLSGAYANVNFITGIADVKFTNLVNAPINSVLVNAILTPTAVPVGTGIKLYLLRIEFFQQVNAVQYSLKNGAYNSLAVIEVA